MQYDKYENPDPQDASQDTIDRLRSNRGIHINGNGKRAAAKGLAKTAKGIMAGIKMAGTVLAGILVPMGILLCVLGSMLLLLFMGIYGGMAGETLLTDAVAQARDVEVEAYATNRANKANIFNTWIVPGEGSWHEQRIQKENKDQLFTIYKGNYSTSFSYNKDGQTTIADIGYTGADMAEWQFLGRLADNEGKEQRLINYWGDVYAPMLFDSLQYSDGNLLEDEEYRNANLQEAGFNLKPYFYYKPSTITITSENNEGETSTTTNDIFLLVEAYTIRGHEQYQYRWETTESGSNKITKEVLDNTLVLDDGKRYLASYLDKKYKMESDKDNFMTVTAVFEAMQGFTAKQEWMEWLNGNGIDQARILSSASIPMEYRSYIKEASQITGIPENILAAIIMQESTWNPNAVNEKTGCFGLTQLHPNYWPAWAKRYGFDPVTDQWNPRAQIIVGANVLKGYIGTLPDWESDQWDKDHKFRAALARYGGYGEKVQDAGDYINAIVAKAKAYMKPTVFPVAGYSFGDITSPYAYRVMDGKHAFHGGIDIGCPAGSDITSASSGIITEIGANGQGKWGGIYGNYIVITDMNYKYLYAHLSNILVKKNQIVAPGQIIALSGNTGKSTGAHLHFGISAINGDPKSYTNTINPVSILQVY